MYCASWTFASRKLSWYCVSLQPLLICWDQLRLGVTEKCAPRLSPLAQDVDFFLIPNSRRLRNSHCHGKDHGGRSHKSKGSGACSNKGCSGGTSVRGDVRPAVPGDDLQRDMQSMPFPLSAHARRKKISAGSSEMLFLGRNHKGNRKSPKKALCL